MERFFHSKQSGRKQKDATTPTSDLLEVPTGSTTPSSSSSTLDTFSRVDGPRKGFRASLRDRFSGRTHSNHKDQQPTVIESNTTSQKDALPTELEDVPQNTSLYSKRLDVSLPDNPNHQSTLDTIDYSIQVLGLFDELSKFIALVVPDALGLALKTITSILEKLKKMMENKQAWKELLVSIDERQKDFNDQLSGVQAQQLPQQLVRALKKYAESLQRLAAKVMEEAGVLEIESPKEPNFVRIKKFADQFLNGDSHEEDIKAYEAELTVIMGELKTSLTIYIALTIDRIDKKADNLKALIFLEGSSASEKSSLGTKHKSCLEGTRVDVLEDIRRWYQEDDDSKTPVYCIGDVAGTGKSTISYTMAEEWSVKQCFVYFFSNTSAHEARTLCISFAKQIIGSCYGPDWDEYWAKLSSDLSSPIAQSVENLWERLVHQPLKMCIKHERHVVVVDALDECDQTTRVPLLKCLLDACSSKAPSKFRILLTTRKEEDIVNILDHNTYREMILPRSLLDSTTSQTDIERYVEHRLKEGNVQLTIDQRGQLVRRCDRLFMFASLACSLLERGLSKHQAKRLQEILGGFTSLHMLYHQTLYQAEDSSEDIQELLKSILGVILVAREPLSITTIAALLSEDVGDVGMLVKRLGSILGSGTVEQPVYILHATLKEFLIQEGWIEKEKDPKTGRDRERYMQNQYYILELESHLAVLKGCLSNVMAKELVFNICRLETSCLMNEQVTDMDDRVRRWISDALRYSCLHWASHLDSITCDEEIFGYLEYFIYNRFLYWLEVLSVTKCIRFASKMLVILIECMRINERDDKIATDMHKFVVTFTSVIAQSAPHIYLSALPFAPRTSPLSRCYIKRYPRTLMIQTGGLSTWPSAQTVSFGHTYGVNSVAFSPDGKLVISGSNDKTIRIWDAETGEPVGAPLEGHNGSVMSVVFSPDGKFIASGSGDKTIRVWNIESREAVETPFKGHTGVVTAVAFSPNGKYIVSGSWDETVRMWSAETGVAVGAPFEGHTGWVRSVAFSPNGKHVISGSDDKTVRKWDAETGNPIGAPFKGHTDEVLSVAFSHDGKYVVSGSEDHSIRVWNIESGEAVGAPFEGHSESVDAVAFSPNGNYIVSGSKDNMIRVWNAQSGGAVGVPFEGHTSSVVSVSFSPDGKRIASGSMDKTIRVWDADIAEGLGASFDGHTNGVQSVAFSSDGKLVVSGSDDKTVRIWDAENGGAVGLPFEGHTDVVLSVAFSPDGKRVASGSTDHTIRVWDVEGGGMIGAPFKGHTSRVLSVSFSPNVNYIVSSSDDKTVRVWDVETGGAIGMPFEGHTKHVTSVAFSHDGKLVVSGSADNTIRVWNVEGERMVRAPLEGHIRWVNAVAFSHDGKHIVSGSDDKTLRVWNVESGGMIGMPFEGHTGYVTSVTFSPDGTRLISGSLDGTIRIWDFNASEQNSLIYSSRLENGWVVNSHAEPLFWVPPQLHAGLLRGGAVLIIGRCLNTALDLSSFVYGESWAMCKGDD